MRSRLTSRDPGYATCVLTYATLRVYSSKVAPEAMTAELGMLPDWSMTKDRPHALASGRVREATVNGWFRSSKGRVASKGLRDHLGWLLDGCARPRPA